MKFIFCLLFFFSFQTAFGGSVQVSFVEGDVAVFSLTNQEWIPVVNHAVLEESRLIQIKNGGRVSYFKTDSRNKSETLTINSNGTRRLTFSSKKLIFDDYELKEMPIVTGGNDIVDELPGLGFIEAWKRFVAVFVSPRKRQKVPAVGEELNVASLEYAKALGHIEVNKPYDSDHVLKFMRLPETMELSWVGIKQHKKPYGIYVWPTSEIRSSVQVRTSKNTASVAFSDWDSYYVQVASKDHQFVSRRIRVDVISDSRKNIFTNEKIVDRKVEIKNALWHIVSPPQNAYLNLVQTDVDESYSPVNFFWERAAGQLNPKQGDYKIEVWRVGESEPYFDRTVALPSIAIMMEPGAYEWRITSTEENQVFQSNTFELQVIFGDKTSAYETFFENLKDPKTSMVIGAE